jgi:hypothetical protein
MRHGTAAKAHALTHTLVEYTLDKNSSAAKDILLV